MFDYETLRVIWWALIGVLLMGFAVTDGFDMGSASMMPFIARNDNERRVIINTVGPVWEGNQVWLITGAGSIFAAWPYLYAVAFSGFYLAMFVVLCSLILRPVGFKFRSKMPGARWRSIWDWCLFLGGTVPPIIFGVALGNTMQGVPFTFDDSMRMTYHGTFFDLLNPFALLCGVVSLCMVWTQGAAWLSVKTEGVLNQRSGKILTFASLLTLVLFMLCGIWVANNMDGYRILSVIDPHGPSNPMLKTAAKVHGAWMSNYEKYPLTLLVPMIAIFGVIVALAGNRMKKPWLAFLGSSLMPIGIIGTVGVSMFPFLLPSSADPNASLTVWDASSSRTTLIVMALVTVIFIPLILAYTSWVYYVLRGKVTTAFVKEQGDTLY